MAATLYTSYPGNWVWSNATTSSSAVDWVYYPTAATSTNITLACNTITPVNWAWQLQQDLQWHYPASRRGVNQGQNWAVPARDTKWEEAKAKAEALLLAQLDTKERRRWEREKQIHVVSQHGRKYCIDGTKRMHNIFEVVKGVRVKELCVYANGYAGGDIPLADNVLAQMLALKYAEDHLLGKANAWDLRDMGRERVEVAA